MSAADRISSAELAALTSYTRHFAVSAVNRANAMVVQGLVRDVARKVRRGPLTAKVGRDDGEAVTLVRTPSGAWVGACSCEAPSDCLHCLALAQAILVRPSLAEVKASAAAAARRKVPVLVQALSEALGRPLDPLEADYLRRIDILYRRAQQFQALGLAELNALGVGTYLPYSSGYGGERIVPWKEFPATIVDFWHAAARAALRRGVRVPDFMAKLDAQLPPSPELVAFWRHSETQEWMRLLGRDAAVDDGSADGRPRRRTTLEVRLLLAAKPIVQVRTAGEQKWQNARPPKLEALLQEELAGGLEIAPASMPLWNALTGEWRRQPHVALEYGGGLGSQGLLAVVMRLAKEEGFDTWVLAGDGSPLQRPEGRLQWQVTEPDSDAGDYSFRLTTPAGDPVEHVLAVRRLPPAGVLTRTTLWRSPRLPDSLPLEIASQVPAPAIESEPGLRFLRTLGCALPARVEARVRRVPLRPVIRVEAAVRNSRSGAPERLRIEVTALDPGRRIVERLLEHGWTTSLQHKPAPGALVVTEREALPPVADHLATLGVSWDYYQSGWMLKAGGDFPERFAAWLRGLPAGVDVELPHDLASLRLDTLQARVALDCQPVGVDWFDLTIQVDVGGEGFTPEELKLLLDAQGRYVRLGEKGWRRMDWNLAPEDEQELARLGLDARQLDPTPQRVHALQIVDRAGDRFLPAAQVEAIRRRADEIKTRVAPEVPAELCATLRPYQLAGFHFLAYLSTNRFGGVLADDMGLGKTVQTLAWIAWLRAQPGPTGAAPGPVLIVCPKSVAPNWFTEAGRFLPGLKVTVWRGESTGSLAELTGSGDVLVVNYAQLRTLAEVLVTREWLAVIADEAQAIKNPDSQTAQCLRRLNAGHRLALTGTPIENRLLDLWSLMAFAMPGALGARAQFQKSFGRTADTHARRRLAARLRPFLLRRTKSEVARDLPDRIEEDIVCELEGVQQTLYRAEFKKARAMLLKMKSKADLDALRFHFLTSLLRLRQICCHPALVDERHREAPSAKVEALLDLLEPLMEEGNKVLVFSQFVSLLGILRETVRAREWKEFYLAGDTENRGELVEAFHRHEGSAVFLISLKAGGFGLNLTAASYVVLFDPWWNPAVEAQAIDRTHRIGQTSTVIAYRLVVKGSIEEKIRTLQAQKRGLADDVLGEERFSQSLTLDDLRVLFEGDAAV